MPPPTPFCPQPSHTLFFTDAGSRCCLTSLPRLPFTMNAALPFSLETQREAITPCSTPSIRRPMPNCLDPPYAISMWVFDGGGDLQKWKRYCAPPPDADGLSLFISRGPVQQWFPPPTSSTWGAMSRWSAPFSLLSYSWGLWCRNRKSEAETFSRRKRIWNLGS